MSLMCYMTTKYKMIMYYYYYYAYSTSKNGHIKHTVLQQ